MELNAHDGLAQAELWPDVLSFHGRTYDHADAATAILSRETPKPIGIRIQGLRPGDVKVAKNGLIRFNSEVSPEQQIAWALNVPRDPEFDEEDDGIILKDENDRKNYLHYRPDLEKLLLALRGITPTRWQREWFAACNRIRTACVTHLIGLARQMDVVRPGYGFEERVTDYSDQHVVRVLNYVPREGIIAKPHTDRCAITFHLAESAPGLCAYNVYERRPYATPKTPCALCFSGQQLERVTRGAVPAVYHEVENNTPGRMRWALVFFGKMRPK
ncbi:MAG: 2OG-Fe(II) oxygenase superfamily [Candidatus Parcubacteria bacterium]|jgi:hypothetical protein|nr:2OG-Fe(II) oxygenase superfamily [Candidatus Parcubacteria bacterium]